MSGAFIGFTGVIRSRYVLGERRTFVYHNPSPCEIVYYLGQKITIACEEPLHEYANDVTFVCFDDHESATQVVERSHLFSSRRVRHNRVFPAKGCIYDAGLDKHLVCFDRFDGFLPQADLRFLASLENPNSSYNVPGNSKDVVQCEIKALCEALEIMHSEGVSSSSLHLPIGYVWSSRYTSSSSSSSGELKIIMLDVADREDHTSVQWNKILARNAERFGTGLDRYFLNTTVDWPEKDSFMRCFSIRLQEENKRLPMVRNHPFLKNKIWDKFRNLFNLYFTMKLAHSSDDDALRFKKLMVALNSKQFKSEFMPNGEWTRQEMSSEFREFLRGKPRGDSIKYNTKDMGDLVRCLRNVYENGNENGMSFDFMCNEVGRCWPRLVDRIHEKIAG